MNLHDLSHHYQNLSGQASAAYAELKKSLSKHNLLPTEFHVLILLGEMGKLSVPEMRGRFGAKVDLWRVVDGLVDKGFVECEILGRVKTVWLSEMGRETMEKIGGNAEEEEKKIRPGLRSDGPEVFKVEDLGESFEISPDWLREFAGYPDKTYVESLGRGVKRP